MTIAILGGSFNPPHIGHAFAAQQVKERMLIDQIWLMPCYQHPFQKELAPATERLAMTKYLERKDILVSDFEIRKQGVSYTIDTLDSLAKQYPHDSFSLIISSKNLPEFHKWKDEQRIIKEFGLIIFPHNKHDKQLEEQTKHYLKLPRIPDTIRLLQPENLITTSLSSTIIRERIKSNLSITYMVPENVEQYIMKHGLYR